MSLGMPISWSRPYEKWIDYSIVTAQAVKAAGKGSLDVLKVQVIKRGECKNRNYGNNPL